MNVKEKRLELERDEWRELARTYRARIKKLRRAIEEWAEKVHGLHNDIAEVRRSLQQAGKALEERGQEIIRQDAVIRELRAHVESDQKQIETLTEEKQKLIEENKALGDSMLSGGLDPVAFKATRGRLPSPEMRVHEMRAWMVRFAERIGIRVHFTKGRQIDDVTFDDLAKQVDAWIANEVVNGENHGG